MTNAHQDPLGWDCLAFDDLSTFRLYQVLKLRQDVFILEQECLYPDIDELDLTAMHLCCTRGKELLGYLRCLPPVAAGEPSSFGRVVVSGEARGLQLGRELTRRAIDFNLERWPGAGIRIGAQAYLEDFYTSLGFVRDSDVYDEDGIPHIKMVLQGAG